MRFRNKRSGIVMDFDDNFKQANWEPIEAPKIPAENKSESKPKKTRKKEE